MKFQGLHDFIDAAGGRRFLMVIGAGIVDTVLLWFGKLAGGEYVTVTLATVGVYIAGNTYQKANAGKADS